MARASSTSMPRYLTVLSSLVCPNSSCTAHHADLARLAREVRRTCKQTIDDGWRNVLAEEVGDAIARGRLLDCVAELCAQPQCYKARYHASDDHHCGLADMADWISHDGAERQDPARHSQIADCRNGSGERWKHKVQTQGRGDDEDEVQQRRPRTECDERTCKLIHPPQNDRRQTNLDDRVGEPRGGRNALTARTPVAKHNQRHDLVS